jgi:hypothetical protein
MKNFLFVFLFVSNLVLAQVGINTITPDSNSMLDVSATNKGILIPRLTTTQINAIVALVQSLMVFNTDVNLYYYFSTSSNAWMPVNVGSIVKVAGTSYTLTANDNGRIIDFSSNTAITLTVPNTLPTGFQVSITQAGTGQISIVGSGGMNVHNRWGASKTSGQWSKAGIEVRDVNIAVSSGDLR